jgi:long-chain acyl-CoA synthetase
VGVEAKIDPQTRELLVKGPNIVRSYWHCEAESRENWDDAGWYHTRDIAALDADGFLQIEGRLDHMIVLLNGENVSPTAIENHCTGIAGVESAIVIGDHREALVALFAMNEAAVQAWAGEQGHRLSTPWQCDPQLLAWLRGEVERHVNARAGHPYECIRQVAIIDPPSIEERTLTATEKIRRTEIERRHAALIDQLYADSPHWLRPAARRSSPLRRAAAL